MPLIKSYSFISSFSTEMKFDLALDQQTSPLTPPRRVAQQMSADTAEHALIVWEYQQVINIPHQPPSRAYGIVLNPCPPETRYITYNCTQHLEQLSLSEVSADPRLVYTSCSVTAVVRSRMSVYVLMLSGDVIAANNMDSLRCTSL